MCAARSTTSPPQPLWKVIPHDQLYERSQGVNLEALLLHFLRGGRLAEADALQIVHKSLELFCEEENVLRLSGVFTVVGDLHGQFYDLAKIIKLCGFFPTSRYLFLGNCIGGGGFSCETILFLLAAKVTYPTKIFLLRGPNESLSTSMACGFHNECITGYSAVLFESLMRVFASLPLAAVLNKCFFCVHGGLSPKIKYIENINSFSRFSEISSKSALCDLMWADPKWDVDNPVALHSSTPSERYKPGAVYYDTESSFEPNKKRGKSYIFNFASIVYFMSNNKLLCIIRSHEVEDNGYKLYRCLPETNYPCMISVFSAPNHCGFCGNLGAVLTVGEQITIKKFYCSPCPYSLPGVNCFMWSMPFVVENIIDLFSRFESYEETKEA